jgi:hypothetical protein
VFRCCRSRLRTFVRNTQAHALACVVDWSRAMPRHLWFFLLPLGIGCADEPLITTEVAPLRPGSLSNRTALVSLTIQDGRPRFDDVRCRPIDYLEHRHEGEAAPEQYLEVTGPALGAPVKVPVAIGEKNDPRGEASSAWAAGGAILRAPCFGAGTKIALKIDRTNETLATIEVQE